MVARVTLGDVAKAASVDTSLVSRVLRGETVKVRDDTRERIVQAANELGYRPNAIARSLKASRAGAFGLVIPTFNNPVYAQIITGAEAAAATAGSVLMTMSGEGWDQTLVRDALDGGRVDGLLIAGGSSLDPHTLRVPYILVNRAAPGVDRSVVLDDEKAARMAVEHLVALGHQRIGFLAGPDGADTSARRRAGFEAACRDADVTIGGYLAGDFTLGGGFRATRSLERKSLAFTGLVVANAPSAVGALQGLLDAGIEVPADVSVVSIHDSDISEMVRPRLTSVRLPLAALGARGIELLNSTKPNEPVSEIVAEPMNLIARESSGPVRS